MKSAGTNTGSDRAETVTAIPILDGQLGDSIEVEATQEGLEFGGYSVLEWVWIDSARKALIALYAPPPVCPEPDIACDEDKGPS
jgi:hypothetical protein